LLVCLAILAAGTVAVYSCTFSVPLIYDDRFSITENPSIRHLWPIWPVLSPPADAGVGGRPLLNLSFAINYAYGGSAVLGYHLVNLLIHILASMTLFALVRRTLLRPILAERFGSFATPLGLAVAAIWAWHPVQTVSVTYTSQRAESLMGLCYMLTLYCFIRGAATGAKGNRWIWYSLSVFACLAGVATKEVMATAPLMVLVYDRTFISGRFRDAWRRNWPLYLALVGTVLLLGPRIIGLQKGVVVYGVGFGGGIAWWDYGLTECRVIVRYLLLAVWPNPLIFDYGQTVPCRLSEIWPYALLMASLLAATLVALKRSPAIGFAACWFFLILAPTSSIVPLVGQSMAENRVYLSLAGVAAFIAIGAFAIVGRWSLPVLGIVAVCLGLGSFRRNQDYLSEQTIWSDTVAKNPRNYRSRYNLGCAWMSVSGHMNDAIAELEESLRLKPDYASAHYNLGCAWMNVPGHLNDAIAQFEQAVGLQPDFANAHYNLGFAWLNVPGHLNDAIAQFEKALRFKPGFVEAHYNLGFAWLKVPGHLNDAIAQFEEALRLKPDYAEAHYYLGFAWLNVPGHLNDAIAQFEEALRLKPDFVDAHYNLGFAWLNVPGHLNDAIAQFGEALRLKPDFVDAHYNLGFAWLNVPGHLNDAIAQFGEALRLKPDYAEAHYYLGFACMDVPGRLNDAIAQFEEALRLKPNFVEAHYRLALAFSRMPGRGDDAKAQLEAILRLHPGDEAAKELMGTILVSPH
jgi:tetratricopeptide (TPR) repeat protein